MDPRDIEFIRRWIELARQEDVSRLLTLLDSSDLSPPYKAWLRGHVHELQEDGERAALAYEEAMGVFPRDGGPQLFLRNRAAVLRARGGAPVTEIQLQESDAALGLAEEQGDAFSIIEAAATMGELLLSAHIPTDSDTCIYTLGRMEDAWRLVAVPGVVPRPALSRLLETLLSLLLRGGEEGQIPEGVDRAWSWYRKDRAQAAFPGGRLGEPPAGNVVVEFLALPRSPLRVAISRAGEQLCGRYSTTTVDACSRTQQREGDWLRAWSKSARPMIDQLCGLCSWTETVVHEWEELLVRSPVEWSDNVTCEIGARIDWSSTTRLDVVPHGPLAIVPWGMLRGIASDSARLIERCQIVVMSCAVIRDARRSSTSATTAKLGLSLDDPATPERADPRDLFRAIAQHGRVWIAGHGEFAPDEYGGSLLETSIEDRPVSISSVQLRDIATTWSEPMPRDIVMSICEAAEVSRRGYYSDLNTFVQAFLSAGVDIVVAPKWPITELSDRALESIVESPQNIVELIRRTRCAALAAWDTLPDVPLRERIAKVLSNRSVPLCDIAALECYGTLE